jgi:guanine nucleotide-binding protein G(I)/G(S)/G(T) subunit beta-1
LHSQISQVQASKRDQTLAQVAVAKAATGTPISPIRGPPQLKLRRILKGHFGKVTSFHWGGDSKILVSASQDGNLLLWNAVTNNKIQSIPLNSAYVMSVGIEQGKGNLVACGGLDNLCTVYPRNAPEKTVELASHDGFLSCCRFLDESEILTSSGDSTCIRWDIPSGRPISTFAEHTADAVSLCLKDRNIFASCSVDKTAKLWDMRTPGMAVQTYTGFHKADVNGIEFMPCDTNCFATCSQDNTVRLFDLRAYNQLASFATGVPSGADTPIPDDGLTSLAFSKSGRVIFTGSAEGHVYGFDVLAAPKKSEYVAPAFILKETLKAHERHVSCVGVSPSGDALCTASWDGLLKIWA